MMRSACSTLIASAANQSGGSQIVPSRRTCLRVTQSKRSCTGRREKATASQCQAIGRSGFASMRYRPTRYQGVASAPKPLKPPKVSIARQANGRPRIVGKTPISPYREYWSGLMKSLCSMRCRYTLVPPSNAFSMAFKAVSTVTSPRAWTITW